MKKKNILEKYNLTIQEKNNMITQIQEFFKNEKEEEIGIIASEEMLEFFVEIFGNTIYNKAINDTMECFKTMAENMECDLYSLYKND